jgi:HlyD family secretion protein
MRRFISIVLLLAAVGGTFAAVWWYEHRHATRDKLVLYGNVDLRQVQLAFNNNERIAEVRVQEGDHVDEGQVVGRLDISRLTPQVAKAEAQVSAQRQAVARLHNGSRPEEIAQARANLASAEADAANARRLYDRYMNLAAEKAVSQQDYDNSRTALDTSRARVDVAQAALDLAVVGPRKEDIAQAEAQLQGDEAQFAWLRQQLADAQLVAPTKAVVRTRLMEPGEMASPQKPVLSLAILDPKWIRAYVGEPDLGQVHPGMQAAVKVDSFPDRKFDGWIGFISPVAEFTPKTVQTEELRTSLVYEVRVFVKDPQDVLRLGMPATVELPLTDLSQPAPADRSDPTGPAPVLEKPASEKPR